MTVDDLMAALHARGASVDRLRLCPCFDRFALRVDGIVNGQEVKGFLTPPRPVDAGLIAENLIAHAEALQHLQK